MGEGQWVHAAHGETEALRGQDTSAREPGLDTCWTTSLLGLPTWLTWPESAGPWEVLTQAHPFLPCAGELAGLRQQMTTTEEKVALDKELMAQKLMQAEREAQASLREQRAAHEEDLQRLQQEKVRAAGSAWVGL